MVTLLILSLPEYTHLRPPPLFPFFARPRTHTHTHFDDTLGFLFLNRKIPFYQFAAFFFTPHIASNPICAWGMAALTFEAFFRVLRRRLLFFVHTRPFTVP